MKSADDWKPNGRPRKNSRNRKEHTTGEAPVVCVGGVCVLLEELVKCCAGCQRGCSSNQMDQMPRLQ